MPDASGALSPQERALRRRNYRAMLPAVLPKILPADWARLLKKPEQARARELEGIVDLLMQLEEICPSEDQAKVIAAMKTTSFSHRENGKLMADLEKLSLETSTRIDQAPRAPRKLTYWSGYLWVKVVEAVGGNPGGGAGSSFDDAISDAVAGVRG